MVASSLLLLVISLLLRCCCSSAVAVLLLCCYFVCCCCDSAFGVVLFNRSFADFFLSHCCWFSFVVDDFGLICSCAVIALVRGRC